MSTNATTSRTENESCQCNSCGCNWLEGKYSPNCPECDGYSMARPCLICNGSCGTIWRRDVEQSNKTGRGSWSGVCGHQRQARLRHEMRRVHQVTDAMEMLSTDQQ